MRGKKECWELTEGVVSSTAEGGSGIGSVRNPWRVMVVDQMAKKVSEKWSLLSGNSLDNALFDK